MTEIRRFVRSLPDDDSYEEPRIVAEVIVTEDRFRIELPDGAAVFDAPLEQLVWQLFLMEPDLLRFRPE